MIFLWDHYNRGAPAHVNASLLNLHKPAGSPSLSPQDRSRPLYEQQVRGIRPVFRLQQFLHLRQIRRPHHRVVGIRRDHPGQAPGEDPPDRVIRTLPEFPEEASLIQLQDHSVIRQLTGTLRVLTDKCIALR